MDLELGLNVLVVFEILLDNVEMLSHNLANTRLCTLIRFLFIILVTSSAAGRIGTVFLGPVISAHIIEARERFLLDTLRRGTGSDIEVFTLGVQVLDGHEDLTGLLRLV